MAKRKALVPLPVKGDDDKHVSLTTKDAKFSKSSGILHIDLKESSPESIAAAMRAALPKNSTTKSEEVKLLLQSFQFFKSSMEQQTSEILGPIVLALPDHILQHIFSFLRPEELVHRVSLVYKRWLHVSRSPTLWNPLSHDTIYQLAKQRIDPLRKLLRRDPFSNLKSICMMDLQIAKKINVFAEECPTIEEIKTIDYGISTKDLLQLPRLFPNLKRVLLKIYCFGSIDQDRVKFCDVMSTCLVDFYIRVNRSASSFTDEYLDTIGKRCTNLEKFHYSNRNHHHRAAFTESSVTTLVTNNKYLASLKLINTKWISSAFYSDVVKNSSNLDLLVVFGYDETEGKCMLAHLPSRGERLKIREISESDYDQCVFDNMCELLNM